MNTRLFFTAFLIAAHTLLSGAVSFGDESVEPPLSPDGEAVMNDPDTAAYCLAHARDVGERLNSAPDTAGYFNWTLGTALVTHNETWGIVCRIDFTMAGQDVAPRVNRLVLYAAAHKLSVMIAVGQDIAPLEAAAGSLERPQSE
jgi:hypothetical protein